MSTEYLARRGTSFASPAPLIRRPPSAVGSSYTCTIVAIVSPHGQPAATPSLAPPRPPPRTCLSAVAFLTCRATLCMCGTSSSLPIDCGASLVPKVPCLPAAFIAPLARPHTHHSLLTVLGGCICSTLATCICTVLLHMLDTRWVCPSTMTPGLVHGRASDCSLACVCGSGIPVWILVPISLDLDDDDHVRPRLSARGSATASSGHPDPHVTL